VDMARAEVYGCSDIGVIRLGKVSELGRHRGRKA